jgi:hypothetical protein
VGGRENEDIFLSELRVGSSGGEKVGKGTCTSINFCARD